MSSALPKHARAGPPHIVRMCIAVASLVLALVLGRVEVAKADSMAFDYAANSPVAQMSTAHPSSGVLVQSFTIEAWVQVTPYSPPGGAATVVGRNRGYALSGVALQAGTYAGCGLITSASPRVVTGTQYPLTPGQWKYIACTYDQTVMSVYVNGVLDASTTFPSALPPVTIATYPWTIGSEDTIPNSAFGGGIDNVRIWSVALSGQFIGQNWQAFYTAPQPNLLAAVSFGPPALSGSSLGVDVAIVDAATATLSLPNAWQWSGFPNALQTLYYNAFGLFNNTAAPQLSCTLPGCAPAATNSVPGSLHVADGTVPALQDMSVGSSASALTIEVWFRFATPPASEASLVSKNGPSGADGMKLNLMPSPANPALIQVYCGIQTTAGYRSAPLPTAAVGLQPNTWYHAACSYDGQDMWTYVNGVVWGRGSYRTVGPAAPTLGTAFPWTVGWENKLRRPFIGDIDNVRIWGYAPSQRAVARNAFMRLSGLEGGLLSYLTIRADPTENGGFDYIENKWGGNPNAWVDMATDGNGPDAVFVASPSACTKPACGSQVPLDANGNVVNACATNNGGCGFMQCVQAASGRFCDGWPMQGSSTTYLGATEPTVCAFRGNFLIYVRDTNTNAVYVLQSTDGGQTWPSKTTVSNVQFSSTANCVVVNNYVYLVGVDPVSNSLVYYSSQDGVFGFTKLYTSSVSCGSAPTTPPPYFTIFGFVNSLFTTTCAVGTSIPTYAFFPTGPTGPYVGISSVTSQSTQPNSQVSYSYHTINDDSEAYFTDSGSGDTGLNHFFSRWYSSQYGWDHPAGMSTSCGPTHVTYGARNHVFICDNNSNVIAWRSNGIDPSGDGTDSAGATIPFAGGSTTQCGSMQAACTPQRCMIVCTRPSDKAILAIRTTN